MKKPSSGYASFDDYTISENKQNDKINAQKTNTITVKKKQKSATMQTWLVNTDVYTQNRERQNNSTPFSETTTGLKIEPGAKVTKKSEVYTFLPFEQNNAEENARTDNIPAALLTFIDHVSFSELVDFFCPYCSSVSTDGHIRKDKRGRKHKKDTQRWHCKKFNRKFTNDLSPFNYPLWICYLSCQCLVAGMELEAIKKTLELEADEKGEGLTITTDAIRRLLEKILQFVHEFEESIEHPIESYIWQMDELSQRMSKQNKKRRRAWIITVSAESSRYMLSTYVCGRRSYKNSRAALQIARSRAKSDPKVVKSDGLRSHEKAAEKLFHHADAVPKDVHFGHISYQERIHKTMRMGALPKRRRFHSPQTLLLYTEFDRIDYNHIRTNDNACQTPAQQAGIDLGIKNWRELLMCALRFHMKKRVIEAHRKLQQRDNRNSSTNGGNQMAYEYDGWTLYVRDVKLKNGNVHTIYFFSKKIPKSGTACDLPANKKVVIDRKFGFPRVIRK
jgi:hypothetical protein